MIISEEIQNSFYLGERSEKVKFCANDVVEVIGGKDVGIFGSVISIISLDPEVIYQVENGETGFFINVQQGHLKLYVE
jgi:hypothetical protein